MNEIIAMVRRNRAQATKEELARIRCAGYFQFPVLGRGRQRGLRGKPTEEGLTFLPKVLFDIVVEEDETPETIEAILRANQSGQFGDGKIFVVRMKEAFRVSTGERESVAEGTLS